MDKTAMEYSESPNINGDDDNFFDAVDDFPFYDCVCISGSDDSVSQSPSTPELEPIDGTVAGVPIEPGTTPESVSLSGLGKDTEGSDLDSNSSSQVTLDTRDKSSGVTSLKVRVGGKHRFSPKLKDDGEENVYSSSQMAQSSGASVGNGLKDDVKENSTITTAIDKRTDSSVSACSRDSSSKYLFFMAGLVAKVFGFQLRLFVRFFTFPVWLLYFSVSFAVNPFHIFSHGWQYLSQSLLGIWGASFCYVQTLTYGWLKERGLSWKLAFRVGWGLLWSGYVCFVLLTIMVSAFIVSGIMMNYLVEKPIHMEQPLNFDYTEGSPVAFVPVMSCPELSCGVDCSETIEAGRSPQTRVIPRDHKLQIVVSLTLPESDYNINLGMFQVRVDFLSANSVGLASLRQPCMLPYKSQPLRILSTFFKIAPLITGYLSETQLLKVQFQGFTERDVPTSCLRVVLEQRAEFKAGAGIPEIYEASLILESELPLMKRILWYWKKTAFVWVSIMIFVMELVFALLCCLPIILPRVHLRGGFPDTLASQMVHRTQS